MKKVPDEGLLDPFCEDLPLSEQRQPPEVGWTSSPELLETNVTQPTHRSSQLEVPTLEPDVLEKVDLFGYAEWDPKDHWEAQSILREYVDVFTKDDLDLGQTSIMKHKITLDEGPDQLRNATERSPQVQNHLQEMIDAVAIGPSNSSWASAVEMVRKKNGKLLFVLTCKS